MLVNSSNWRVCSENLKTVMQMKLMTVFAAKKKNLTNITFAIEEPKVCHKLSQKTDDLTKFTDRFLSE